MWSVQQTPSPDDPSCQPFVLLPLTTFLYYSLKESLYFYFALSTTGHTARLPIDHHDQLGSVYEFMPLNESGALIHWGQRDFSKFIALCSFVYSPTSKNIKYAFEDLTLDLLMTILLLESENNSEIQPRDRKDAQ